MRVLPALLLLLPAHILAAPAGELPVDRGAMLYETHCIECHDRNMHWRERRLARDWDSLRALVDRWQQNAQLRWTDADIDAVARYLSETVYRFPRLQAGRPPAAGPADGYGGGPGFSSRSVMTSASPTCGKLP